MLLVYSYTGADVDKNHVNNSTVSIELQRAF